MRTGISLSFDLIDCNCVDSNGFKWIQMDSNGFLFKHLRLFLLGKEKEVPGVKQINMHMQPLLGLSNCEGT